MSKLDRVAKALTEEQQPDGSFGRFHSMNSKLKQRIPTTQAAVWLMYDNSFTRDNEICNKTCIYMETLLNDLSKWPDALENNKFFKSAVPLFIASSLALFGSEDKKYNEICSLWIDILISAFINDEYSSEIVNVKSKDLIGEEIEGSYIGLHSLNALTLYAFNIDSIPPHIQRSYLRWLYNYDGVITYTNTRPDSLSKDASSTRIVSLLSRFNGFTDEFPNFSK